VAVVRTLVLKLLGAFGIVLMTCCFGHIISSAMVIMVMVMVGGGWIMDYGLWIIWIMDYGWIR
jgi:hypothetical protein